MRVRIEVKHETTDSGGTCWWATSPDMPRWLAAGESLEELQRLCGEAVEFVLGRRDLTIEYLPGDPSAAA